ncbi:MAG: [LysW]-aminoadipate kinase [Planctomycetota bacterium JB042]
MNVVKIGGSAGVDLDAVCDDVAAARARGPLVLVHGCSHAANLLQEALGQPPRFVTSPSGYESRFTDRRALEILVQAAGGVNAAIVERLQRRGVRAVGLSGLDGGLWKGPRKTAIRAVEGGRVRVLRDGYTGAVREVDASLLRPLLAAGCLPVLGPPALSDDGFAVNVDGDRAAAATAAALGADTLAILSNVPGLLADVDDPASLVREIPAGDLDGATTFAKGRMRIKLLGAKEALAGGVRRVVLGDARVERPITRALDGRGTAIVAEVEAGADAEGAR